MERTLTNNDDWRHGAACAGKDPEAFFPIKQHNPDYIRQVEEVKRVCNSCEVKDDCLREALIAGDDWGIWGGMTEKERRALRRRGIAGSAIMRSIADLQR